MNPPPDPLIELIDALLLLPPVLPLTPLVLTVGGRMAPAAEVARRRTSSNARRSTLRWAHAAWGGRVGEADGAEPARRSDLAT